MSTQPTPLLDFARILYRGLTETKASEEMIKTGMAESEAQRIARQLLIEGTLIPSTPVIEQPVPVVPPNAQPGNVIVFPTIVSQPAITPVTEQLVAKTPTTEEPFPDVAPAFPQELKNLNRWIVRTADKEPRSAYEEDENLGRINAHDPQYQADYNTALGALDQTTKFAGLGFVFRYADGLTGIDFDHCINPETLEIPPNILEIIQKIDSYAEFSPSRSGIHIFTKGWQFPIDPAQQDDPKRQEGSKHGDAEIYSGKRYFTVTGNHVPGTPLTVNERDLGWLYTRIVTNKEFVKAKQKDGTSTTSSESSCQVTIKKSGTFASKYNTLMNGTIIRSKETGSTDFAIEDDVQILEYESQSSADYALLRLIADKLKTDDAQEIEREFLKSSLGQRSKATRGDYLERSITKLLKEPRLVQLPISNALGSNAATSAPEGIPIVDDPNDDDKRFEMTGDTFDTKVYDDMAQRSTPYPDPGDLDLISLLAKKLVHGTPIPLAYVREPLKAAVLHALDGKLIHPGHRKLTMRGNYFSLGESEGGKTTGLEYALAAAAGILAQSRIHTQDLFRYKSEQTFIRSFTPEGTIQRDSKGVIKSGRAGNPSQFLYIKEGNLVATCSEYFSAVFSRLTDLYDQTSASTESMTNGDFDAGVAKASTVMCFTPVDFKKTFGGKGTIGGGGLNRWALVNPPEDHSYDRKDWEPLSQDEIALVVGQLAGRVRELRGQEPVILAEETGAVEIRLEVKNMLKKAGKAGKRLLDYFMREQVAQASVSNDGGLVMTTLQAEYARKWVTAQLKCRLDWPSDSNNQIEAMEHAIRRTVNRHFISETKLKDMCNIYREGSGGWYAFNAARNNMMASDAIKLTGRTRKGTRTYCPGSCVNHPTIK